MTDTYWHILRVNRNGVPALGYGDGRHVAEGKWLSVTRGTIEICAHGLHACYRLVDTLVNHSTQRFVVCKVEVGGIIHHGREMRNLVANQEYYASKLVASKRKVVAMLSPNRSLDLLDRVLFLVGKKPQMDFTSEVREAFRDHDRKKIRELYDQNYRMDGPHSLMLRRCIRYIATHEYTPEQVGREVNYVEDYLGNTSRFKLEVNLAMVERFEKLYAEQVAFTA